MKFGLTGNMKLAAVAIVAGVGFAAWKGHLLDGILNKVSPPATLPPPPTTAAPNVNAYPPVQYPQQPYGQQPLPQVQVPAQINQPTFQFPQFPAIPTGIAGVPPPIVNPFSNIPILPDSGLANNSLFRPAAPQPYPYINPLLYNSLTNASSFPGMQPLVSDSNAPRIDFFDPSNPPTESQSTTSTTAPVKSSVAYAHVGTRNSKSGRFGSLRDSAFTINPLQQEAIGNSYRRPAFYAPHTLSNI
jgi:hypothetical protein